MPVGVKRPNVFQPVSTLCERDVAGKADLEGIEELKVEESMRLKLNKGSKTPLQTGNKISSS